MHKAVPDSKLPGSNIIEQLEADMEAREIKALRLNEILVSYVVCVVCCVLCVACCVLCVVWCGSN